MPRLSAVQVELVARIIDAVEDEARVMRAHTGHIMTAAEVVTLLKNHAALGRMFKERQFGDSYLSEAMRRFTENEAASAEREFLEANAAAVADGASTVVPVD